MSNYSVSLKGIGIENFKAFGKYQHFDLAPITIITGPNNSGKSALIAALELLSKNDILSHLDFHTDGLEIGEYSQVLNINSQSKDLKFVLDLKINRKHNRESPTVLVNSIENLELVLSYSESKQKSVMLTGLEIVIENNVRFATKIKNLEDGNFATQSIFVDYAFFEKKYLKRLKLQEKKNSEIEEDKSQKKTDDYSDIVPKKESKKFDFKLLLDAMSKIPDYKSSVKDFHGVIIEPKIIEEMPVLQNLEEEIRKEMNNEFNCRYDVTQGLPLSIENAVNNFSELTFHDEIFSEESATYYDHVFYRFSNTIYSYLNKAGKTDELEEIYPKLFTSSFKEFLNVLGSDLIGILNAAREEIQNTFKLEAQRASKQRLYLYQEINIPLTRDIISAAKLEDKTGKKFLKFWTGENGFNLFEDFKFDPIPGVGFRFQVFKDGDWRELADLGFGTRQVLPVILGIYNHIMPDYRKNKNMTKNMLIIEEPESNLHPKLQSLLADLFIAAKKSNPLPLIIETHSEYLIRKLQYLVAKKEILPESIAIHYIGGDNGDGEKDIFEIKIDDDGSLDRDFGTGFFDEATNWKFELMRIKHEQKN